MSGTPPPAQVQIHTFTAVATSIMVAVVATPSPPVANLISGLGVIAHRGIDVIFGITTGAIVSDSCGKKQLTARNSSP